MDAYVIRPLGIGQIRMQHYDVFSKRVQRGLILRSLVGY